MSPVGRGVAAAVCLGIALGHGAASAQGKPTEAPDAAPAARSQADAHAQGSTPAARPWDGPAFSGDPSKIALAAAAVEVPVGSSAVWLLEDFRCVYDTEGRRERTFHVLYRIARSDALTELAVVTIPWGPWYLERPTIRARVITPDGAAHELDQATIDESPLAEGDDDMFDDRRKLQAPLPAAAVGAVVETELVLRDKTPLFDKGSLTNYAFGESGPVLTSRVEVSHPASLSLRYVTHLMPGLTPRRTEENGIVRLVFEAGPLAPQHQYEPFGPPDAPIAPELMLTTGRSWAEVATRYAQIVDDRIRGGDIGEAVKRAIGDATTPEDKAGRILAWVHKDFRYTGVEFNEAAIVPRTLSEVLDRKYGDCKDLSTFVVAALRAAGLRANVALLQAGAGYDVDPDMPGLGLFNHAIVVLEGKSPIWIDPTSPHARVGELPTPDQGRRALIASPATKALVITPRAVADENEEIDTRHVYLSEGGKARFSERSVSHGSIERTYRAWTEASEPEAVRSSLETYAKAAFLATLLDEHSHMDPRDLSGRFWIDLEAGGCGRGVTDAQSAAVGISLAGFTARVLPLLDAVGDSTGDQQDPRKQRRLDLVLPEPSTMEWRYVIHPPPGYAANRLPDEKDESLVAVNLKTWYEASVDGTVVADFRMKTVKDRLTPEELSAFRKAMKDLADRKPIVVTFHQVGEAHLAAGRVREALGEFRRLAVLHPKESLHHRQMARALIAAGLGEAAREEARRGVELEPTSAGAYFSVAYTLQRDLVGRFRHAPGFDRAGALAALRKAKELDPKNAEARSELGILLEYDEEGERYSRNADLEGALAEYRSMREELDDHRMDGNILFDLGRLRRFAEVESFGRPLEPSQARSVAILTAVAATKGAREAMAEAQTLEADVEERRKVLGGAVLRLLQIRSYPEAAALLTESAKGAPDSTQLLMRADLTAKTRRVEEMDLSDKDPGSFLKSLLARIFASSTPASEFASVLSSEVIDPQKASEGIEKAGADSASLGSMRRAMRRAMDKTGLATVNATDVTVSNLVTHADGDDAVGYKVTMSLPAPGVPPLVFFVLKENGRYRLLGSSSDLPYLGAHALLLLDAHNVEGARRWLDWARDEVTSKASTLDPLAEHPFHRLYAPGAEADPAAMRLAAASLAAPLSTASAARAALETCRTQGPTDAVRTSCELAMVRAHAARKEWKELDESARRLLPAAPDSLTLYDYLIQSAVNRRDHDSILTFSESRLAAHPDDPHALRNLVGAVLRRQIPAKPEWSLRRLVDSGKATAYDYNELAWTALVEGRVDDEALTFARRAASETGFPASGSLHTLACLYAETDRPAEAYTTILESMEKSGSEEPLSRDWYVFGRLAELYGFPRYAQEAYAKVKPPEEDFDLPGSTYTLAKKRLAALEAAKDATPTASAPSPH